jgi:hypothetical protein
MIPGMEQEPSMTDGTPMPSTSGSVQDYTPPATVKEMPFKFDPKRPDVNAQNNVAALMLKEKENKELFEKHAVKQFDEVAKQTIKIQVEPLGLNAIAQDGRMKNVHEVVSSRASVGGSDWAEKYKQDRVKYETESIGVPSNLPNSQKPIYGWLYSGEGIEPYDYGSVTLKLKDSVKKRTSMTAGDSLNESAPVLVQDILDKKASLKQIVDAGSRAYLSQFIKVVSAKWEGRFASTPTIDTPSYWEAQIYGGVSLDDIEAITIPNSAIKTRGSEIKVVTQETIDTLKAAGIKVVIE